MRFSISFFFSVMMSAVGCANGTYVDADTGIDTTTETDTETDTDTETETDTDTDADADSDTDADADSDTDSDADADADSDADSDSDSDTDTDTDVDYDDADGDGYDTTTDCDDTNADVYPDADEYCNGIDDNCDGVIDEDTAIDTLTWYFDADADGYGDAADSIESCDEPTGYVSDDTDCDDTDSDVNPDATEIYDGVDNDCDGNVDNGVYDDADADGYDSTTDCDDTDYDVNPGADEICDGVDNNCDGDIDEDSAIDALTWYLDADADGYGDAADSVESCDEPSGYVDDGTDCDGTDSDVNPDAEEVYDGVDNNCDGDIDEGTTATHEVCVVGEGVSSWELAMMIDEVDKTNWVTESGGIAQVLSPILTGADSDRCYSFEGSMAKFNGHASGSGLWGAYIVGADNGHSSVVISDGGSASVLRLEVDGVELGFCSTSYDLCYGY